MEETLHTHPTKAQLVAQMLATAKRLRHIGYTGPDAPHDDRSQRELLNPCSPQVWA